MKPEWTDRALVNCPRCAQSVVRSAHFCPHCGRALRRLKSRTVAIVLAILLGGVGAHKFYLGSNYIGLIYVALSWTLLPAFFALFEAFVYMGLDDRAFRIRFVNERPHHPPAEVLFGLLFWLLFVAVFAYFVVL